ncbi:replication protein RepA [Brackiella oedipodis]|uniref:replication protein RepA n=1 Tax=Brackiella oedipodis TaxID=124225 RepID=UPI000687B093|nr:replication protein RepA [Brackiella oedipodis]
MKKRIALANEVSKEERQRQMDKFELGVVSRCFAQISLPHSKPDSYFFSRCCGTFKLNVVADPNIGLPYGTYPRLLLAWICTEATKTKSTKLELGTNQSEFLRKLDISRQGSTIASLKEQTTRLVNSTFSVNIKGENFRYRRNLIIAESSFEFWETHNGGWESHLNLNPVFLEELLAHPVPIDLHVLNDIRKSPLLMDAYTWIAYRTYLVYTSGGRPVKIRWEDLQTQFACGYEQKKHFKTKFLAALNRLSDYYPELTGAISSDTDFLTVGGVKLIPYK